MILELLVNDANSSTYWCKSYSNFKNTILDEGVVLEINF